MVRSDWVGDPSGPDLQFAFGPEEDGFGRNAYLPHNHQANLVVYTGTYDNDTTRGWWSEQDDALRHHLRRYLSTDASDVFINSLNRSVKAVP